MNWDKAAPQADGKNPGPTDPAESGSTAWQKAFAVVAVLSAVALAVVVVLWIVLAAQNHSHDDTTRANQSAATAKASATAQSFYRDLLTAESAGPITPTQLRTLSRQNPGVTAHDPVDGDGVVLVDFRVWGTYVQAGGFGPGQESVIQCYRATLLKPGAGSTGGKDSLSQTPCATPTY